MAERVRCISPERSILTQNSINGSPSKSPGSVSSISLLGSSPKPKGSQSAGTDSPLSALAAGSKTTPRTEHHLYHTARLSADPTSHAPPDISPASNESPQPPVYLGSYAPLEPLRSSPIPKRLRRHTFVLAPAARKNQQEAEIPPTNTDPEEPQRHDSLSPLHPSDTTVLLDDPIRLSQHYRSFSEELSTAFGIAG